MTFTLLDDQGYARKKRRRIPCDQWNVFLEKHHDPYISKETWEHNVETIAANAHMNQTISKRAPQNGNGLILAVFKTIVPQFKAAHVADASLAKWFPTKAYA